MGARRVLVTGVASYWGGRLAQRLEAFDDVAAIVGVDTADPTSELDRTEFVRVGAEHALIQQDRRGGRDRHGDRHQADRGLAAGLAPPRARGERDRDRQHHRRMRRPRLTGPAAGAEELGARLRLRPGRSRVLHRGPRQAPPPRTRSSATWSRPRRRSPSSPRAHPGVHVTVLRCANVLGASVQTSHVRLLSLPVVPTILGFDPRYQFVHEDDVVEALVHVAQNDLPGAFNVAADGVLALTEVISLLGKYPAPDPAALAHGARRRPMRAAGLPVSEEMLGTASLRPRARQPAAGGDRVRVLATRRGRRALPGRADPPGASRRGADGPTDTSGEVEEFLHRSPNVVRRPGASDPNIPADASLGEAYRERTQIALRNAECASGARAGFVESDAGKPWNHGLRAPQKLMIAIVVAITAALLLAVGVYAYDQRPGGPDRPGRQRRRRRHRRPQRRRGARGDRGRGRRAAGEARRSHLRGRDLPPQPEAARPERRRRRNDRRGDRREPRGRHRRARRPLRPGLDRERQHRSPGRLLRGRGGRVRRRGRRRRSNRDARSTRASSRAPTS